MFFKFHARPNDAAAKTRIISLTAGRIPGRLLVSFPGTRFKKNAPAKKPISRFFILATDRIVRTQATMNFKKVFLIFAFLATEGLLNFVYPLIAAAYAIPVGMEIVIIAYCLIAMLVPLSLAELVGIGALAGLLNILSDTTHLAPIISMHVPRSELFMALFNLISEPVGIVVCFFAFAYLVARIRSAAPFAAAFLATLASGFAYLAMVFLFNPHLIAAESGYTGAFLLRVAEAAFVNAVAVQLVFMVVSRPVTAYLAGDAE